MTTQSKNQFKTNDVATITAYATARGIEPIKVSGRIRRNNIQAYEQRTGRLGHLYYVAELDTVMKRFADKPKSAVGKKQENKPKLAVGKKRENAIVAFGRDTDTVKSILQTLAAHGTRDQSLYAIENLL